MNLSDLCVRTVDYNVLCLLCDVDMWGRCSLGLGWSCDDSVLILSGVLHEGIEV